MNNWEGGIRVNSWISGGFLPTHMRGTTYNGLVTAWDYYATFCSFAGVDPTDHRAAAADLPAIDSHSHHMLIMGTNLVRISTPCRLRVGCGLWVVVGGVWVVVGVGGGRWW